ncbi:chloroperoxidase-like protein [Neolentinus lepideus HHB14362 ss-1]|uniref:Chloroperoxidase-like protein n=1 Tax=Neolentinus lepideus HHB14362 ss-1 TaxID=1314782 RepID=A0A165T5H0_9AGAM|nr:chloroperoxidase-like protein [Neolentinus lepideus HHB14362 ss-1]
MSSSSVRVRAADSTSFLVLNACTRLLGAVYSNISTVLIYAFIFVWDLVLAILNLVLPDKRVGEVVPLGRGGIWPAYQPPRLDQEKSDSRCSCPALNTLANHGLLPRDGRRITFKQLSTVIRHSFNFGPTFCFFVPWFAANILGRSYWSDSFDLSDLDVHNGIEHDASLTRDDTYHSPNQGRPAAHLIEFLFSHASGAPNSEFPSAPTLTASDLSETLGKRRVNARAKNSQFSLSTFHKMFASSNAATMVHMFGGSLPDLRTFLLEERLPLGWETKCRRRFGLTFAEFNGTVLKIEMGIHENHDVMMWRLGKTPKNIETRTASSDGGGPADSGAFATKKDS